MAQDNDTDGDDMEQTVVVESGMGPAFGHYHRVETGTWIGPEEMSREEAEDAGYSRCASCWPETFDKFSNQT